MNGFNVTYLKNNTLVTIFTISEKEAKKVICEALHDGLTKISVKRA